MALLGVAAVSMLAFAATADAKSKHKKKLGPVLTQSVTVSGAGAQKILTATATCPSKTRAVGGGFLGTPGGIAAAPTVFESQKVGQNAWRVSSQNVDFAPFDPVWLTASVYCRKGAPATSVTSATATIPASFAHGPAAPATCALPKQKVVGGGFVTSPPVAPAASAPDFIVTDSLATGPATWLTQVVTLTGGGNLTGFAYCAKQKKGLFGVSAASPAVNGSGAFATASASCPGKLSPGMGGFSESGVASSPSAGSAFIPYESERVDRSWRVSGLFTTAGDPGTLNSTAYCG
jgi:hypothetical protein